MPMRSANRLMSVNDSGSIVSLVRADVKHAQSRARLKGPVLTGRICHVATGFGEISEMPNSGNGEDVVLPLHVCEETA